MHRDIAKMQKVARAANAFRRDNKLSDLEVDFSWKRVLWEEFEDLPDMIKKAGWLGISRWYKDLSREGDGRRWCAKLISDFLLSSWQEGKRKKEDASLKVVEAMRQKELSHWESLFPGDAERRDYEAWCEIMTSSHPAKHDLHFCRDWREKTEGFTTFRMYVVAYEAVKVAEATHEADCVRRFMELFHGRR